MDEAVQEVARLQFCFDRGGDWEESQVASVIGNPSSRFVVAVGLVIAILATASPVMAQDLMGVIVDFSDSAIVDVLDQSGNGIGQGEHTGTVRCYDGNCGQKTELQMSSDPDTTYTYKFKDLLALDPTAERAVVGGTGVISNASGKEKFAFSAVFENNGDGSLRVTYFASRPDASFVIPNAPGTFTLVDRP